MQYSRTKDEDEQNKNNQPPTLLIFRYIALKCSGKASLPNSVIYWFIFKFSYNALAKSLVIMMIAP